jgi:hypothetical protein
MAAHGATATSSAVVTSRKKTGASDVPPFKHQVALLILAFQCVHMLFRMAYSAPLKGDEQVAQPKDTVIQNLAASLLETDHNNPSDEAIGAISTAAALYQEISKNRNALLVEIDYASERLFTIPNVEHTNAMIGLIASVIQLQTNQTG